jgi:uncharacterized membrane protein YgaE (UPF0421/DUF939 family)
MIAAVIVTDLSPAHTRELALPRLAGTVIGAGIGAAAVPVLGGGVWTMALGVLVAMFMAQTLKWPEAAKLAGYVCGLVVLEHGDQAWTDALLRFVETVLGIAAAVLVSLVPKLIVIDHDR